MKLPPRYCKRITEKEEIVYKAPECDEAEVPLFADIEELLIQENAKNDYINKQLRRMGEVQESNLDTIMQNINNAIPRHEQTAELYSRLTAQESRKQAELAKQEEATSAPEN